MPWYWWAISGLLAIGSLWAVLALLIGDRARGRRRCPKCWHSMEGLPEPDAGDGGGWVCPECGRAVTREKDLFRTRRKRGVLAVVAVGLLAVLAWYGYGVHQRRAEGTTAWVPSLAAVLLIRPLDSDWNDPSPINDTFRKVILSRKSTPALPDWQYSILVDRLVDKREESAWAHVHIRDVWIRGEPIPVTLDFPRLTGGLADEWLTLNSPNISDRVQQRNPASFDQGRAMSIMLNGIRAVFTKESFGYALMPASNASAASVDLALDRRFQNVPGWPKTLTSVANFKRTIDIQMVESEAELLATGIITPFSDPEIDRVFHPSETCRFSFTYFESNLYLGPAMMFDIFGKQRTLLAPGSAIVYTVDLMYEGRVVLSNSFGYPGYFHQDPWHEEDRAASGDTDPLVRTGLLKELEAWVQWHRGTNRVGPEPDLADWVIRVTPRPDRVLRHPEYDRYWVPADGSPYLEYRLADHPELARDP